MRVEHRAVSAILTVLLHLLILFALVRVTASGLRPAPPAAEQERSAASLRGAGERTVSVDIRPGLSASGLVCPGSSYIGVGVTSEPGSERIILVGDNTPASRAGLQHDDIVLNPDIWQDAHKDGAWLRLLILRDGVRLALSLQVGKICIG